MQEDDYDMPKASCEPLASVEIDPKRRGGGTKNKDWSEGPQIFSSPFDIVCTVYTFALSLQRELIVFIVY